MDFDENSWFFKKILSLLSYLEVRKYPQIIVKYTKKTTCNYLLTDPEIDWRNALVERTEKIKELAEYPHCQPTYWVMNSGRVKSQMFDMQSQPSMRPVQSKPASIASGRSLTGLHGPIN